MAQNQQLGVFGQITTEQYDQQAEQGTDDHVNEGEGYPRWPQAERHGRSRTPRSGHQPNIRAGQGKAGPEARRRTIRTVAQELRPVGVYAGLGGGPADQGADRVVGEQHR
jgi:hypothetical protein